MSQHVPAIIHISLIPYSIIFAYSYAFYNPIYPIEQGHISTYLTYISSDNLTYFLYILWLNILYYIYPSDLSVLLSGRRHWIVPASLGFAAHHRVSWTSGWTSGWNMLLLNRSWEMFQISGQNRRLVKKEKRQEEVIFQSHSGRWLGQCLSTGCVSYPGLTAIRTKAWWLLSIYPQDCPSKLIDPATVRVPPVLEHIASADQRSGFENM